MTTIPLRSETIREYIGDDGFNCCAEISQIHAETEDDAGVAAVEATIPGSSTRSTYTISVRLRNSGNRILFTSCTCPIRYKCKHINKVLHRIRRSRRDPIPGPNRAHRERQARRQNAADQMARGAAVYIAFACKSEMDSGSDFGRSYWVKESFDQEVLGVFFSNQHAIRCAKAYVEDQLGYVDDESYEDEDEDEYCFDSSDIGEYDEDGHCDKVWVECRAIEDASASFHP